MAFDPSSAVEFDPSSAVEYKPSSRKGLKPSQISKSPSRLKQIGQDIGNVASQFSYGGQQMMGADNFGEGFPEPVGTAQTLANIAGKGAGLFTGIPEANLAASAIGPAIKSAGTAMKSIKPIAKVSELTGKVTGPVKDFGKDAAIYFGSILSSVPEEDLMRIASKESSGKSILKGKFDSTSEFRRVGNIAQKALNEINKKAGQAVNREAMALSNIKEPVKINDILDSIDNKVASRQMGRENLLTQHDKSIVSDVKNKLLNLVTDPNDPNAYANELHAIKTHIGDALSWSHESVQKPSDRGVQILKDIRSQINEKLRGLSKQYAKVNDESSKYQELRDRISPKLKDATLPQRISGIMNSNDPYFKEILQEIDKASPRSLKFYEKLLDVKARNAVKSVFGGRGGGSGSEEGVKNLARVELLRALGQLSRGVGSLAAYPIMSPKGQSQTIQASVAAPKIIKKAALSQPVTTTALRKYSKPNRKEGEYSE